MKKIVKTTFLSLGSILALALIIALANWSEAKRLYATITVFDEDKIVYNFAHMNEPFNSVPFQASTDTFIYEKSEKTLPQSFQYFGHTIDTEEFLERRATTSLIVIKDDIITHEEYFQGMKETDRLISWSISKSVISALMGIYVDKGMIDIELPVTHYVPELNGSGYEGVRIKDVLQMSSGVTWNEDYGDFNSDVNKMGRALAIGGSLTDVAADLGKARKPGTQFAYVSMDTQALALILRNVTNTPIPTLLEKHIWTKIGTEDGGYWLTDDTETVFAMGGMTMRPRDYARFGRLYLNNGNWEGEQIIPRKWVEVSITPDAPHIMPGPQNFGYGYQWWLGVDAREREFMAIGVYGQYIYINQPENIVIVKTSADRQFMDKIGSMHETLEFFRGVTDSLATSTVTAATE